MTEKQYRPRLTKQKLTLLRKGLGHWLETGVTDMKLRKAIMRVRAQLVRLEKREDFKV